MRTRGMDKWNQAGAILSMVVLGATAITLASAVVYGIVQLIKIAFFWGIGG